jgi:hypothetical protein
MKIYNKTTKELFDFINFEKSNLIKSFKRDTKITKTKYCYFFPQRVHVFHDKNKIETVYFFLFWRVKINHLDL